MEAPWHKQKQMQFKRASEPTYECTRRPQIGEAATRNRRRPIAFFNMSWIGAFCTPVLSEDAPTNPAHLNEGRRPFNAQRFYASVIDGDSAKLLPSDADSLTEKVGELHPKVIRNLMDCRGQPDTENQADALSGLKPEHQALVCEASVKKRDRPTIAIIKAVRGLVNKSGGTPLTPILTKLNNVASDLEDTGRELRKLSFDATGREFLSRYVQKALQKLEQFAVPVTEAA